MKSEYISLSVAGLFALVGAGMTLGSMISGGFDVPGAVIFIMLMLLIRQDAREQITPGSYTRGWLVWRRTGPYESSKDSEASA